MVCESPSRAAWNSTPPPPLLPLESTSGSFGCTTLGLPAASHIAGVWFNTDGALLGSVYVVNLSGVAAGVARTSCTWGWAVRVQGVAGSVCSHRASQELPIFSLCTIALHVPALTSGCAAGAPRGKAAAAAVAAAPVWVALATSSALSQMMHQGSGCMPPPCSVLLAAPQLPVTAPLATIVPAVV